MEFTAYYWCFNLLGYTRHLAHSFIQTCVHKIAWSNDFLHSGMYFTLFPLIKDTYHHLSHLDSLNLLQQTIETSWELLLVPNGREKKGKKQNLNSAPASVVFS